MTTLLLTGGAGFIGANLVRKVLAERPDWKVVNLDALTYAGDLSWLEDVLGDPRHAFEKVDLADRAAVEAVFARHAIDHVAHLAAESHVDRSILEPAIFVRSNVLGTQNLLDVARQSGVKRFLHVSTDEVYGTLGATGKFTEETPLAPNSPYSASKAGSDLLARAAFHTFGFPVVITRCSNNYGPRQFPEKLIPLMIANALDGKPLPVYGDGQQVRDWIHVDDHCAGLLAALERGRPGEVYNFGGETELPNLTVVRALLAILGRGEELIRYVADRPGHDRRYAIDCGKAKRELGWMPRQPFAAGLRATVDWYRSNAAWVARIRSGAYRDYYDRQYGGRLAPGSAPGH
ncbi:MAG: dTDP-glucose 4,6-dehydratase [Planctomycetes bacterium]|nr:dTDP-glucose 4,6-dehydratase [Planctomycetota bacterium]